MTQAPERARVTGEAADCELALLAKALGHPARVRILRLLLEEDVCFYGEVAERLPLAQATVSQHLKTLKKAGLVAGEVEPPRTCYHANRERVEELCELVGGLTGSGDR